MAEENQEENEHTEPAPEAAAERIDARSVARTCISLLAMQAWEAMGLLPDAVTKKVERRLDDAQLAIDAAGALIDVIRAHLTDAERRELDTLLTNLRLNFIEQRGKS